MGECDVFGEEEFVDLINKIFKENDQNKNSYFDTQDQVLEQFILANQTTNRFYTITCENREGGTLIKIKINDFILRVLNYSETRRLVLNSIQKKIALHSQMHYKNCETFVAYQKYLVKGDPSLFTNPLNALVCQSIVYSKHLLKQDTITSNNQNSNSGKQRVNSPFDSSAATTGSFIKSKDQKSHSINMNITQGWTNRSGNPSKTVKSQGFQSCSEQLKTQQSIINQEKQNWETSNQNSPELNKQQQKEGQNKNLKSYKFQFISEQCDDSIFAEKIPLDIKLIHKERQQQKQEAIQIFKFQQTKYEKVQLKNFQNKYQQSQIPNLNQKINFKTVEPSVANRISKLGYKLNSQGKISDETQKLDQVSFRDNYSNIFTQSPEKMNTLMQITSCGEKWANTSIECIPQSLPFEKTDSHQISNKSYSVYKYGDTFKQRSKSPQKDKQNLRLKPLMIVKQKDDYKNDKNSFNNFYSGVNSTRYQFNNQNRSFDTNNNSIISPKHNLKNQFNYSRYDKYDLNKSQDIYHPLNYYERTFINSRGGSYDTSNQNKCSNQLMNSVLKEFKVRSMSQNKSQLINCSQIIPAKFIQYGECQIPNNIGIAKKNRQNNKILQQRVVLDSI